MTEAYELYRYVFIIGAILSGVFLLLSLLLFFLLKIPQVIGNLSGSTARKAIRKLREESEHGEAGVRGEGHNVTTGELGAGSRPKRGKDAGKRMRAPETTALEPGDETTALMDATETTILSDGDETTILSGSDETSILSAGGETAKLTPQSAPSAFASPESVPVPTPGVFSVDFDITFIHTDEIIR